jgi:hypothetical protein
MVHLVLTWSCIIANIRVMEPEEIYFRTLNRLQSREDFLEKEMLDSDVHHLEVRTGFFDKLAILAAGSIAVGISFLASGAANPTLLCGIRNHLSCLAIAFILVLISFALSIIHNLMTSSAVTYLSKQLESLYKAANTLTTWRNNQVLTIKQSDGSTKLNIEPPDSITANTILSHEADATRFERAKERLVENTNLIGIFAVVCLVLGYIIGLTEVFMIITTG